MKKLLLAGAAALAALAIGTQAAHASSITVKVGYADNLRSSIFFPNPFDGTLGSTLATHFYGGGPSFDSAGVLFINSGSTDLNIGSDFHVDNFRDGTNFAIWSALFPAGGLILHPNESLVLAQTGSYNFDSSDNSAGGTPGSPSLSIPTIHVTIDGVALTYLDTGHVLDTGGFDLAGYPALSPNGDGNESLQWRLVGTTGITDPGGTKGNAVPEAGTLAMIGAGVLPLAGVLRRRRA